MNKLVQKAKEMDMFNNQLPELEIGDIVTLGEVWDGEGDVPEDSYSYHLSDKGENGESFYSVYINYEFEVIEENDEVLETLIIITDINLI